MAEAPGIPMLGSQISLVSKSDVRYTGRLFNIDMQESTIALQSVQSFGTEGRRKDGAQLPASDQIYDYVVFRGSDISELTVLTNGPGAPEQPQQPLAPPAQQAQVQAPAVSSAPPAPQEARGWQQQGPPPQQQAHQPGGQQGWAGSSTGLGAGAPQPPMKLQDLEAPPGLVGGQQPPPGVGARAGPAHAPARAGPVPAPTVAVTPTAPGWQPRPTAGSAQQQQAPARQAQAPGGHPPGIYATSANGQVITAARQANGTGAAGSSLAVQAAAAAAKATAGPVQAKPSFAQAAGGGGGGGGGGRGSGGGRRGGHRGGGRGGGRDGRDGRDAERKPPLEVPKEDFNFEAAFAKFNKDNLVKEAEEKGDEQPGKEKFEDDFFDTMSSDATAGSRRRAPFKEQRKQDAETFGTLPNAHRYFGGQRRGGGGRGRGGGRGGPGRGGNRGRGRGRSSQADGPQAGVPQPVEAH